MAEVFKSLREETDVLGHQEINQMIDRFEGRAKGRRETLKAFEAVKAAEEAAKTILTDEYLATADAETIAHWTNAWKVTGGEAMYVDSLFGGKKDHPLRKTLSAVLDPDHSGHRMARQVWRSKISAHIIDRLSDNKMTIDPKKQADVLEKVMEAQIMGEHYSVAKALRDASTVDPAFDTKIERTLLAEKMKAGMDDVRFKDIWHRYDNLESIQVLTGGTLLHVDFRAGQADNFIFKNLTYDKTTGRAYAQMKNGCEGNMVIFEWPADRKPENLDEAKRRGGTERQRLSEGGTERQRLSEGGTERQRLSEGGTERQRLSEGGTERQRLSEGGTEKQRLNEGVTTLELTSEPTIPVDTLKAGELMRTLDFPFLIAAHPDEYGGAIISFQENAGIEAITIRPSGEKFHVDGVNGEFDTLDIAVTMVARRALAKYWESQRPENTFYYEESGGIYLSRGDSLFGSAPYALSQDMMSELHAIGAPIGVKGEQIEGLRLREWNDFGMEEGETDSDVLKIDYDKRYAASKAFLESDGIAVGLEDSELHDLTVIVANVLQHKGLETPQELELDSTRFMEEVKALPATIPNYSRQRIENYIRRYSSPKKVLVDPQLNMDGWNRNAAVALVKSAKAERVLITDKETDKEYVMIDGAVYKLLHPQEDVSQIAPRDDERPPESVELSADETELRLGTWRQARNLDFSNYPNLKRVYVEERGEDFVIEVPEDYSQFYKRMSITKWGGFERKRIAGMPEIQDRLDALEDIDWDSYPFIVKGELLYVNTKTNKDRFLDRLEELDGDDDHEFGQSIQVFTKKELEDWQVDVYELGNYLFNQHGNDYSLDTWNETHSLRLIRSGLEENSVPYVVTMILRENEGILKQDIEFRLEFRNFAQGVLSPLIVKHLKPGQTDEQAIAAVLKGYYRDTVDRLNPDAEEALDKKVKGLLDVYYGRAVKEEAPEEDVDDTGTDTGTDTAAPAPDDLGDFVPEPRYGELMQDSISTKYGKSVECSLIFSEVVAEGVTEIYALKDGGVELHVYVKWIVDGGKVQDIRYQIIDQTPGFRELFSSSMSEEDAQDFIVDVLQAYDVKNEYLADGYEKLEGSEHMKFFKGAEDPSKVFFQSEFVEVFDGASETEADDLLDALDWIGAPVE